jgi:hypothetical protein
VRSYLADGRLVQWRPPHEANPAARAWAVDAELTAQEVPPALAARFGGASPEAFWVAWTRVEVVCKLLAVPVGRWLAEHGLDVSAAGEAGVAWFTEAVGDITVTVGGSFDPPR